MSDPTLKAQYGNTVAMPVLQTAAAKSTAFQEALAKASQEMDTKYKEASINNMNADNLRQERLANNTIANTAIDNARADAAASGSGSGRKLTPTQQSAANYDGFISKYQDEDGEDIYNYLASGQSELKPGSSEYNKAVSYSRNKYYQTIIDRNNQGAYVDLQSILEKGVKGNPDYYRQRLGSDNFNKLVALSKKDKADREKAKKAQNSGSGTSGTLWDKTYNK
jgi:phage gp36-like protein